MKSTFVLLSPIFAASLLTSLLGAQNAYATLGQSARSIDDDQSALVAVRKKSATAHSLYSVQEIESGSAKVREYVSSAGVVFGIAWNGRRHPDLSSLLGSYAEEYQGAAKQTPRKFGQRRSVVKTVRIVVEKWGHMRNLQGRAYDPSLIPSGVNINEIK